MYVIYVYIRYVTWLIYKNIYKYLYLCSLMCSPYLVRDICCIGYDKDY